jgi:hypothetical protein
MHLVSNVWANGHILCDEEQEKIRGGFFAIICKSDESCLLNDNKIHSFSRQKNLNENNMEAPKFVLLLLFVTGGNYTTPSFSSPVWNNEEDIIQVRKIKKSTIKLIFIIIMDQVGNASALVCITLIRVPLLMVSQ